MDGASRSRTGDLLGAIQALCQLSYSPAFEKGYGSPACKVGTVCTMSMETA